MGWEGKGGRRVRGRGERRTTDKRGSFVAESPDILGCSCAYVSMSCIAGLLAQAPRILLEHSRTAVFHRRIYPRKLSAREIKTPRIPIYLCTGVAAHKGRGTIVLSKNTSDWRSTSTEEKFGPSIAGIPFSFY